MLISILLGCYFIFLVLPYDGYLDIGDISYSATMVDKIKYSLFILPFIIWYFIIILNILKNKKLVMHDDKIENSFYILNNKLLRFEINDLNDKMTRYNQNLYYHDKQHLEESNLPDYLLLIRDKLHELNAKLDEIRVKQLKNKARYHIKTKAEQQTTSHKS